MKNSSITMNNNNEPADQKLDVDEEQLRTLWCGGVAEKVDEEILYELFLNAGPLERVTIPRDKETKKQRNFAFVLFQHAESTRYAFDMLQGTKLFGQPIRLQNKETGLGMGSPSFRSPRPPQNIEILDGSGRSRVWAREGRQRSVTAPVGGVQFSNYQQFCLPPRHHFQPPPPFWSGGNYHAPVPFPIFDPKFKTFTKTSINQNQNDAEKLLIKYVDYEAKGDRDEGSTKNKKKSGNKDEIGNVTEETENVKESEAEKSEIRDKRKSKIDGYQKRGSRSRSRSGSGRSTSRNKRRHERKRSRSRSYVRSRSRSRSSKKSYRSRRSNSRSYERRRSRSRSYERRRSRSRSKNRDYERRSARKYYREYDGRKRDYYRSRNYRERSGSYERRRPLE